MLTERVAVIIPNWNGARFLPDCLESLRRQTYTDFAVYVVDNGSHDASVPLLRERYPEFRVVELPENRGFSAAMNAGIAASRGDYVAALNNDTEAHPRWLEALMQVIDADPDIGFCASKLLDFRLRDMIDSFGDDYSITGFGVKLGTRQRNDGRGSA